MNEQVKQLETLVEISRQLGTRLDFKSLLEGINDAVLEVLECERSSIFLHDRQKDQLYSIVASHEKGLRFPATKGIAGHTFQTRQVVAVHDAYSDVRFNPEVDRDTGFTTRNLLSIPLSGFSGEVVGVLQALNRKGDLFTDRDEHYATILGSLAGTAIQRQMLLQEYLEKQKLAQEMEIAREIQRSLLPKSDPSFPGFDIAGWNQPALETGGDFYDFVPLSQTRFAILLGDATGHGVGPALIISECRALTRALLTELQDVPEILDRVNDILVQDLRPQEFVTLFFGVLDVEKGSIEYVSAGHAPLFVWASQEKQCSQLEATTRPLGLFPGLGRLPVSEMHLQPGDMICLLTDGFWEWENPEDEEFGKDRVARVIEGRAQESASLIIKELHQKAHGFARGAPQSDDLTAVVIKRT